MSNDMVVQALVEYLEESDTPELYWPKHWSEEVCFSRWAADELINAILDHPMASADDIIEEFAIKMTAFSVRSDGTDAGRIFSIAAQFAYETLELFREEYVNA